jgi:hypothetical protein
MQHNNREESSQELSPWLRERLADRARPFTAQPITPASIPATGSDTRPQIGRMSESNSRLARWVIDHSRLASVVSRATHLSLLPRAFETIWRKPAFVPAVWQRVLDLPWFRQGQERRRGFTETKGDVADGQITGTISMQNELYPDTPVPSEEATDTYPLSNSYFPPQPITGSEPLNITRDHPHTAHTGTLPVFKKDAVDTPLLDEPTQRTGLTKKVPSVYPIDEAYPAIIQNLLSQSVDRESLPVANYGVPHDAQGTDNLTSPFSQSLVSMPGSDKASDTPAETGHSHTETAPERLTKTYRPTYQIHPDQSLHRSLTPITQRTTWQRKTVEVRPSVTVGNIGEGQASPAMDLDYPNAAYKEGEPVLPIARQAALPLITNIPGGILNRASQPSVPETANSYDEPVKPLPDQKLSLGKVSRVLPYSFTPRQEPGLNQTQTAVPFISRQTKQGRLGAEVTQQPEGVPYQVTESRGSMNQFFDAYAEEPLSYQETPSIAGETIQPMSLVRSISRPVALPHLQLFKSTADVYPPDRSKNYRLPQNREYAPISLDHTDTYQPALELPIAYSVRPKADSSVNLSEELFRHTSDDMPRLTHSGDNGTAQLAFTPIARAPEAGETSQASATESGREEVSGKEPSLDLKALAREIYPLIKRIIMVERERRSA